jgi:hypothetical protein
MRVTRHLRFTPDFGPGCVFRSQILSADAPESPNRAWHRRCAYEATASGSPPNEKLKQLPGQHIKGRRCHDPEPHPEGYCRKLRTATRLARQSELQRWRIFGAAAHPTHRSAPAHDAGFVRLDEPRGQRADAGHRATCKFQLAQQRIGGLMNTMANSEAPRNNARASATLPQRKAPVLQATRQPFSVLQTGRAPAQLSLFLRANINMR